MRFFPGMACCKPDRVTCGLECDLQDMLGCAATACCAYLTNKPESLPLFIHKLLTIFMPGDVLSVLRSAGCEDRFVPCAARRCAELETLLERQIYAGLVGSLISEEEFAEFKELHAATWRQMRGK